MNTFLKKSSFKKGMLVLALVIAVPILVFAAAPATPMPAGTGNNGASGVPTSNVTSVQNILDSLCTVFGWLFYFLIALAIIFIVLAAYKYLTAGGDSEKVKGATRTILYAAIAVGIALLARAIPLIVADFLGASGNIGNCSSGGTPSGTGYTGTS